MGGKKDKDLTGRKSVADKYDQSGRKSKIPAAYPNTMMVDLQVYVVPREKWVLSRRLYRHNIVEEGISLGFVRVLPQLSVHNLRRELQLQLGSDLIPRDFTFIRSVGNIFVQLKPKQEMELKVKNFIPPFSTEPEIYILEVLPQEDSRMISPLPMLLREDTPPHICHDLCHHSRARKSERGNQVICISETSMSEKPLEMLNYRHSQILLEVGVARCKEWRLSHAALDLKGNGISFYSNVSHVSNGKLGVEKLKSLNEKGALEKLPSKHNVDSPQPTTPFPPINISPSPTPTPSLSLKSSCTPASMSYQNSPLHPMHKLTETNQENGYSGLSRENSLNDEDYEDYEDDTFIPLSASVTPPPEAEVPEPEPSCETAELPPEDSLDTEDANLAPLMHQEEVSVDETMRTTENSSTTSENVEQVDFQEPTSLDSVLNADISLGSVTADQLEDSLNAENSDTVSLDARTNTESNSSPETVIHVLKSENHDSENENTDGTERPMSNLSTVSQTILDEPDGEPRQTPKPALARQFSILQEEEEETKDIIEETIMSTFTAMRSNVDSNQGTPTPSQEQAPSPSAERTEEESMEQSLTSAINTLSLTPPTIITTPASASGERTESVLSINESETMTQDETPAVEETPPEEPEPEVENQDTSLQEENISEEKLNLEDEILYEYQNFNAASKPKKRLKSVKKTKPTVYTTHRKPSNYPQRTNKVTLARQALAREKRRVYVEERIQNYIKNAQAHNIPLTLPQMPSLTETVTNQQHTTNTTNATNAKKTKKTEEQQKEITSTVRTSSTTSVHQELGSPKLNELQSHLHSKTGSPQTLPFIPDSNNYYLNKLPHPPTNLSAIPVARVPNHHRRTPLKPPLASFQPLSLPNVGNAVPEISIQSGSETLKQTIIAIPSNNVNVGTTQKTWKGVEHHGYFYSFRVRQSGPVQMMDKGVQTGAASESPQSHSYTLSFSETRTSNSSFVISSNALVNSLTAGNNPPNAHIQIIDERDKILREITDTVQLRHDAELRRADLVQRANDLQTRVKEKRDKINRRHEFWHKKYIEESALTRPLEASCSSLRAELNTVHRRLLAHLEGRDLPLRLRDGPSKKANYKIMAARLQHEIKELQQKVKAAKLKLESEIKLKEQADREVREIRNDLAHKKVVMSLARSQVSTLPTVHPRYESLVY
ncbi:unnamed protein product [Allacma fusca]|uniref:Spermatogenesis-associated protein 1 C-terminal domain-containing protein n=1 Tax=Allacma fusca TaxID=39272 RepID=A0A8J2KH74_9HEXA|nr:unnamed protein product [Allacma fusca]